MAELRWAGRKPEKWLGFREFRVGGLGFREFRV